MGRKQYFAASVQALMGAERALFKAPRVSRQATD